MNGTCKGCRYDYRGRCIHKEPCVYVQQGTALCLEAADALIVEAEAIAAEAWAGWQSEYDRETVRLALLADEERQSGIDWAAIACLWFIAVCGMVMVGAVARVWR